MWTSRKEIATVADFLSEFTEKHGTYTAQVGLALEQ